MTNWLPSLNSLRAFEATARLCSFKKAADELSVTPAAVKQLVTKLEDAVGQKLVSRDGQRMALTSAGLSGLEDLSSGFRLLARGVDRIRLQKSDARVIVSVDPSFAAAWLVPKMENFKLDCPGIEVLIDSSMQIVNLTRGDAHVGIRFGVRDHGDLVVNRLFDEELSAMCSPSLLSGSNGLKNLKDLEQATLLRWDLSKFEWAINTRAINYWRSWLDAVGANDVSAAQGITYSDYNLAVQAAVAGQGVILGSRPVLQPLLEQSLLIDPFDISSNPQLGYDIVTTQDALQNKNVERFVNWMLDCVKVTAKKSKNQSTKYS
jgi:LysR family glycine cleavage system transcriptional activator